MTHLLSNTRDRSGLIITIALHAGVAAIALLAVTTTTLTRPPPPIITRPIPETPGPTPEAAAPLTHDLAIPFDVPLPEPIVDTAPASDTSPLITAPEPPVRPADPGTGTGTTAVADPPPAGPTRIARLDPRHAALPPYPAASRRLGEEGVVIIHVRIGRDGRVLAATLAQSSGHPRLDAAALAHASATWRFTPALFAGVAVEATRDIKVDFRLASAAA
jgi:protein TonB